MLLWRRKWQPTPVFLPGEYHGQGSLVGYSPWDRKESDTTGHTAHTVLLWSRRISSYKWLLPVSLPSGGVPVAFLLTKKFSKISRCVWPRLLSKEPCLCTGTQKERKKVKLLSCVRLFATPWTVAYYLLHPWDFPGKNTGVGCHFLLQVIFPAQGSHPGLPHCRQTLYHLSHQRRTQNTCDFACGPLRTECLFPIALWLSQAPLVLKPDILRAFPGSGLLGWGTQCGTWTLDSLRSTSTMIFLPFVACSSGEWVLVLTMLFLLLFYLSHCGSFFTSLVVENLSL